MTLLKLLILGFIAGFLATLMALTAVAFFVVLPLKGLPIPPLWPRFASGLALNGAWGFGTALLLRLMVRF